MSHQNNCKCFCHRTTAYSLIVVGLVFLLGNIGVLGDHVVGIVWPIFVTLIGVKMAFGSKCKCCDHGPCGHDHA